MPRIPYHIKFLLIVASLFCIAQAGDIREIVSFKEAAEVLTLVDENSIVLFDVDEVIIMRNDKIFWPKFYAHEPIKSLIRDYDRLFGHRLEVLSSKILLQAQSHLIEPEIVSIIDTLHQKQCKVLGLTKMRTGNFGLLESFQQHRFNQLKNLGIDFRRSFETNIVFTNYPQNFNNHAMIYNGIILSNESDKGEVLGHFLDHLPTKPNLIVFFDDKLDNLISVQEELEKHNIPYIGFHYRAAEFFPGHSHFEVARFQLEYMLNHEVWISEEKATELLAQSNIIFNGNN